MGDEVEAIAKPELLSSIRVAREGLEAVLAQVSEEQMVQSGVEADWSIKDILAHIVSWERSMVRWVGEALQGEVPAMPATDDEVDRLNEQFTQENRDLPLADVLEAFGSSYHDALRVAEATPEEDLLDPDRFAWRACRPLWYVVAANTWWHYDEHQPSIEAWLEGVAAG
jgi:hypothetical protein